ncbi:MAG: hypothetical protein ABIP94_25745 [Planctomycetota bacterium]
MNALAVRPDGALVAGGSFALTGGASANRIAIWNGANWSSISAGMNDAVAELSMLADGDLIATGNFTQVNGAVSVGLARATNTCPALATPQGSGCIGSGGFESLAATSLPWIGGSFGTLATGLPANAIAGRVLGGTALSVAMPTILAQGATGCTLLVSPDWLTLHLTGGGSLATQFGIPNSQALVGQVLHQQIVPVELDALGNIVAITGTNRLSLTIGAF